jgi:hypothetical protein
LEVNRCDLLLASRLTPPQQQQQQQQQQVCVIQWPLERALRQSDEHVVSLQC